MHNEVPQRSTMVERSVTTGGARPDALVQTVRRLQAASYGCRVSVP